MTRHADMHAIFVLASNPAQVMTHLPNTASSTMMCNCVYPILPFSVSLPFFIH
jgi:hypothetical protein